jgi:hypothetical protein
VLVLVLAPALSSQPVWELVLVQVQVQEPVPEQIQALEHEQLVLAAAVVVHWSLFCCQKISY